MMKRRTKILLAVLAVLVLIQLIQPAHNESSQQLPTDISSLYVVPDSVQHVLRGACYDCHSNNTAYPWYANVQPVGWLLANHIKNGKAELNFSDFGSYPLRKQRNKLQGIINSIKDDEMPLASYKLIYPSARLSAADKALIMDWATKAKDSLSTNKLTTNK